MLERIALRVGALLVTIALAGCSSGTTASPNETPPESGATKPTASVARTLDPNAGVERTDTRGIDQTWIPSGTFLIGTDDTDPTGELAPPDWARFELAAERPQHEVSLSTGYWIDKTEVTNAAYQAFIDDGGYATQAHWSDEGWEWLSTQDVASLPADCAETVATHPRVCITWYEAEAYATWRGGALPTEAQWEFAARGPSSVIFPWGDEWDPAKANVVDSTALKPVGSYPEGASWVSALDMAGNAMEWVADWYSGSYYKQEMRDDPIGPELGSKKVEKGGWWGSVPYVARSSYRHFEDPPTYQDHHIGVRVVSLGEPPG